MAVMRTQAPEERLNVCLKSSLGLPAKYRFSSTAVFGGADVFKALALGATAVGIGRPHIWGLSAFGQEGVETVIALLRRELQVMMAQTGAASIAKIRRDSLVTRG